MRPSRSRTYAVLRRLGIAILGVAGFVLLAGNLYRLHGEHLVKSDAPPGRLVSIGTHRLHLYCVGSGSPVVILNAPVGGTYLSWTEVMARSASVTRICTFDRSGQGWSDVGPVNPPTVASFIAELEALLSASGETPPFVHVGYSLGAILSFLYAESHQDEVAALISIEGFSPEMRALRPPFLGSFPQPLAPVAPVLESLGLSPLTALALDLRTNAAQPGGFSWDRVDLWKPLFFISERRIGEVVGTMSMGNDFNRQGHLGDVPFVVIQGGRTAEFTFADPDDVRRYRGLQAAYSTRSRDGKFVLVPDAGHGPITNYTDATVDAIAELVERLRSNEGGV